VASSDKGVLVTVTLLTPVQLQRKHWKHWPFGYWTWAWTTLWTTPLIHQSARE